MKKEIFVLSAIFTVLTINLISVYAEYSCLLDSDCIIDLSTSNSCLNSSTIHNLTYYKGPYYCRCEYNFCMSHENSSWNTTTPKDCSLIVGRENCWKGLVNQTCYWDDETQLCSPKKIKCNDLDGGLNYASANITYGFESNPADVSRDPHGDYCGVAGEETGKLKEYYCANDYQLGHILYDCPNGCYRGACINYSENNTTGCKNLYWIDNTNKECRQKQFCGAYMYLGLQVFENKNACENATGINESCFKENEFPGLSGLCCNGLTKVDHDVGLVYSQNSAICISNQTRPVCIKCGDGICDKNFESYCNCQKDCQNQCEIDSDCPKPPCAPGFNCVEQPALKCINGICGMTKVCPSNSGDENGKCMFNLSNGKKAEIKIMPETASQNAIDRLRELGFTVELKEVGKGDNAKAVYELTGKKEGKFLGIFKIMASEKVQVDAENGETKVIKPWWSFLASGI